MFKLLKITLIAVSASLLLVPSTSLADGKEFGKIYTECGLGGMFGSAIDDRTASQIVAIVTNITWDLGTTASSSHFTSEDTCVNKKAQVASFINQSYEKLEKEIASGEGEYLDALASLATDGTTSTAKYTSNLRANFAKVVASKEYTALSRYEKAKRLYEIAI